MGHVLDGAEFQSILKRFGWKPVISASQFKHPDFDSHYIVIYPRSAIHYYTDHPWGSYGHSEWLGTPSELENHLLQFHEPPNGRKTQPENHRQKAKGVGL